VLRGLVLNSIGASTGIDFQSGRTLHVESCVINGFSSSGISLSRSTTGETTELLIKDTMIRDGGSHGIVIGNTGSGSLITASLDNCRMEKNGGTGLLARDNSRVTIRNSLAANNGTGFAAQAATSGLLVELNLENCIATNNGTGLYAGGGSGSSTLRVSNATITNNSVNGVSVATNASILSRGNNTLEGNADGNSFPAGGYNPK
jgi:hypothetical protein